MKYFGKSAVALAVSFQFFSVAASAQNLLQNANFEAGGNPVTACAGGGTTHPAVSGTLAHYWIENSCHLETGASVTYALDANTFRTGALSQRVVTSGKVGQFWTQVTLNDNKRYTTSIWLKASAPMSVYLQLRAQGSPYTAYGSALVNVTTNWQQFTFDGYAPASNGGSVAGGVFVLPQQAGTLWMDDASVTAVTDTTVNTPRLEAVPKTYFGMHIHRDPNWPSVGTTIGSDRMWDGEGVQWADIFPVDPALGGTPDWTKFDARINAALAKGAEPVMVLGGNIPRWASSDPNGLQDGSSRYGPGSSAPPVSEAVWTAWVTAVAQRAQGKVKHWEIWNEPYQSGAFQADVPRLARLAQLAYPILKSVDSTNKVLSPSFDPNDNRFMERFLQAGGGAYTDIVSLHAYDFYIGDKLNLTVPAPRGGDLAGPEAMYHKEHLIRNAKLVLTRYGHGSKPIWNTEGGYTNAKTATGAPNDADAAPVVARNLINGWVMGGLDRNFFYSWDHHQFAAGGREAVQGNNVYVKTAVGKAFEQVATWMTGIPISARTVDANGTQTIELSPGIGYAKRFIVWNPTGNFPYTVPSGWDYVSYQTKIDGTKIAIPSGFQATPSPVLLTRF